VDRDRQTAGCVQATSAPPVPGTASRLEQFLQRDRQIRDAPARRVEHRIGDGGGHPHNDQLAESLHAKGIGDLVLARQKGGVERRHVGVDRHEVVDMLALTIRPSR